MLHRRARFAVLAVLTASRILAAQSPAPGTPAVTGAWAGTVVFKADGEAHEDPFHAVLKQDGAALTGTAGPDADHQYRISNGKIVNAKDVTTVTFEVIVNGVHTALDLKLVDGALKGTAVIEGEDGQRHAANVDLKATKYS
ncbi:MAG TPA: hypothetical protein VMS54_05300 [Vicinamibacterales bacterium]|nr:hypothetical protein [Vicinamibacterales bacterium]